MYMLQWHGTTALTGASLTLSIRGVVSDQKIMNDVLDVCNTATCTDRHGPSLTVKVTDA